MPVVALVRDSECLASPVNETRSLIVLAATTGSGSSYSGAEGVSALKTKLRSLSPAALRALIR